MRRTGLCLMVVLTMALAAYAQDKGGKGGPDKGGDKGGDKEPVKPATIEVLAIRATTKSADISPELKSIADKLKAQFKFTGFKLEKQASGAAAADKPFSGALSSGYSVQVVLKRNDGKRAQLEVKVLKGTDVKLNATVTVNVGQAQLFGGMALDGGDQLIIAVSAK
jgi:hypothetical protein